MTVHAHIDAYKYVDPKQAMQTNAGHGVPSIKKLVVDTSGHVGAGRLTKLTLITPRRYY